eukprot:TRINITY_DN596_c0_g1_i11.p1 TRINITY_DN596_c0_g1~~TRINITY_DN596_c0_g1_i11.p1  ORF type:complete len:1012 (-),score=235.84 TRINITY_DN596_c0_g1_i11:14-3049(-)
MEETPVQVTLSITFHKIRLQIPQPCPLYLQVNLDGQKIESKREYSFQDGESTIDETLEMKAVVISKGGSYVSKECSISIILLTPKGHKSAGVVSINLAGYLNQGVSEKLETSSLERCPDKGAYLCFTIRTSLSKEVAGMNEAESYYVNNDNNNSKESSRTDGKSFALLSNIVSNEQPVHVDPVGPQILKDITGDIRGVLVSGENVVSPMGKNRSNSANRQGFSTLLESTNAQILTRTPNGNLPKVPKPLQSRDKVSYRPMINRCRTENPIAPPRSDKENFLVSPGPSCENSFYTSPVPHHPRARRIFDDSGSRPVVEAEALMLPPEPRAGSENKLPCYTPNGGIVLEKPSSNSREVFAETRSARREVSPAIVEQGDAEMSKRVRMLEEQLGLANQESNRLRGELEQKDQSQALMRSCLEKKLVDLNLKINQLETSNSYLERSNRELMRLNAEKESRETEFANEAMLLRQNVMERTQEVERLCVNVAQLEALLREKTEILGHLEQEACTGRRDVMRTAQMEVETKRLRDLNIEFQEKLNEKEKHIWSLEKEIQKLQLQFLTLTQNNENNLTKLHAAVGEVSSLKEQLEEVHNECGELQQNNQKLSQENDRLRNEIMRLHVENGALAKQLSELSSTIENLNKRVLEQSILRTSTQQESFAVFEASRNEKHEKYIYELKTTLKELERQRDNSFAEQNRLLEERDNLVQRIKSLEIDLEASVKKIDKISESNGNEMLCLIEDNKSLKRMLSLLEEKSREKDNVTSNLVSRLEEQERRLVEERGRLSSECESLRVELDRQKGRFEKQMEALQKLLTSKQEKLENLEQELEEARESSKENFSQRLEEMETQHFEEKQSLESELAHLKEALARMEGQQRRATKSQETQDRIEAELAYLRKQNIELQNTINDYKRNLLEMDGILSSKEEEMLKAITRIKNYENEVIKAKREYQACVEEKEAIRRKSKNLEEESKIVELRQRKVEAELVKSKQRLGDIVNLLGESKHSDILEKINHILCN